MRTYDQICQFESISFPTQRQPMASRLRFWRRKGRFIRMVSTRLSGPCRAKRSCAPQCRRGKRLATWCKLPAGSMAVKRLCCQVPNRFTKGCLSRQWNRPLRVNLAFHAETVQKEGEIVCSETDHIFIHTKGGSL